MSSYINISHNSHFIVKNLNGTTRHKRSESWIKYDYRVSGSTRTRCAALGCSHPVEVGAHVRITDKRRRHPNAWYIAPLCKSCNHPSVTEELALERNTIIVEATTR